MFILGCFCYETLLKSIANILKYAPEVKMVVVGRRQSNSLAAFNVFLLISRSLLTLTTVSRHFNVQYSVFLGFSV